MHNLKIGYLVRGTLSAAHFKFVSFSLKAFF
jgi:hypothetical protein